MNNTRPTPVCFVFLAFALALLTANTVNAQDEVKINSRRLSDRVLVTWACDYFQGTNMAVLATDTGLVIIDTGLSPTTVQRQRSQIERELGRADFRYLINTHMHNDHAFANEVFPEAAVVSNANGSAALEREVGQIPALIERLSSSGERYREWAAATSPDSAEGKHAREGVAAFNVGMADLEAGISPRYPSVSFDNHLSMDMGDIHLELFDFRGFHSDSDILILVPEERMLFTGDVFWGGQLPLVGEGMGDEFFRLMDNWRTIIEAAPDLEFIVPGHSDVPLTVEQFKGMYQYLSRLWSDIQAAKEAGTPLVRFLLQNVFAERYPEVADFNFVRRDYNLHQHNIYMLWQIRPPREPSNSHSSRSTRSPMPYARPADAGPNCCDASSRSIPSRVPAAVKRCA